VHRRTWLAGLLIAVTAIVTGVSMTTPAHANTGNQWCNSGGFCLNAWSGGPWVKNYYYGGTVTNNDFDWAPNYGECNGGRTTSTCPGHGIPAGQGIGEIKFTGNGAWAGHYIGDAYNDSSHADASLDPWNGWGTNFVYVTSNSCGSGWVLLYNIRWNGFIDIPSGNPGTTIYLNNQTAACIHLLSPA
jgi:hypothetical protein